MRSNRLNCPPLSMLRAFAILSPHNVQVFGAWGLACSLDMDGLNKDLGLQVKNLLGSEMNTRQANIVLTSTLLLDRLLVAQAATDVLAVSKEAIERQVTSEVEETLKCKSKNRDPYILLRVVCAHMVCAPQYCNFVYLLVVILIQLLVGNQIEHCMTGQLILLQLLSVS